MKRAWNDTRKYGEVPRGLMMLGVRLYPMEDKLLAVQTNIRSMQKSLYGQKDWFYFYNGVSIKDQEGGGYEVYLPEGIFDADFILYRSEKQPKELNTDKRKYLQNIHINAIIGENGTGKSTLVDMLIRLLNNLSAAVFGENFIYTSAQHLHYIENVYASLAVFVDKEVKILTVKGHDVTVETLGQDTEREEDGLVFRNTRQTTQVLQSGKEYETLEVLPGNDAMKSVVKEWFYTIVMNYSLYAYNYRDYIYEKTNEKKIEALRNQMDDVPGDEDYYWLKGVFHKNDGYQTPIVVNPMRQNGYINAQKENHLGKQNLISLAFVKVDGLADGPEAFPFRIINQTHHVVSLYHQWKSKSEYEGFENHYIYGQRIIEKAEVERMQPIWDRKIEAYDAIKSFWKKQIGQDCCLKEILKGKESNPQRQGWDYVVHKTFKIMETYVVYKDVRDFFFGKNYDKNKVEEQLTTMMKDSTHRTRKLRRALAFLKYYDGHYALKPMKVDLDDIYDWMTIHIGKPLYEKNQYHLMEVEDLLPPAPCSVSLGLVDNKNWDDYQADKENFKGTIAFGGLSSGERQIAYSISSLMYHLINIDSTVDDQNATAMETIHYEHANVMMDEVELYFHPDLQRRYIKLLVDALNSMKWQYLSSVNVTLITHSPFVLSDIPDTNLLCLTREGVKKPFSKTFAANIHDLFNNTFILPDTIGELAKTKILEIADLYNRQEEKWVAADENGMEREPDETVLGQLKANIERYAYLVSIVGEEYLHDELKDMLEELTEFYHLR